MPRSRYLADIPYFRTEIGRFGIFLMNLKIWVNLGHFRDQNGVKRVKITLIRYKLLSETENFKIAGVLHKETDADLHVTKNTILSYILGHFGGQMGINRVKISNFAKENSRRSRNFYLSII